MAASNRKNTFTLDTYLSILAVVSSMCALGITFYQANLQRTQQYASVWPYMVAYMTDLPATDKTPQFVIALSNKGVGPAIIQEAAINYKGKLYHNEVDVVNAVLEGDTTTSLVHSPLWKGRVVSPGEEALWITLRGAGVAKFRTATANMTIKIRYASVYNEEWVFNNQSKELVMKVK